MSLPDSTLAAFFRWRKERLPLLPFGGLALVVCLTAERPTPTTLLLTFVWLAALRLLDDVFARDVDAVHHRDRAVVRGPAVLYRRAAGLAVVLGFAFAVLFGGAVFYVGLCVFLTAIALTTSPQSRTRSLLVLLKYPAIAVAVATTTPTLSRLLLLYLCLFVDESFTGRLGFPARAAPFVATGLLLLLF